ncbi:N-acetylglucosaminyl transferase component-domain-containing protein [Gymnopilus junonius]|uniref:N-acetylglucosaminyl transferase component-domain-containing protein n=1 Tax=Gymnopilus junonius TaxID=109634 RepID=A0A9P5NIE5_GYMJU|nr:N-acetylglucosaminyl transferase component-domain-containing protein [Gymnopilus junonius]
MPLPPSSSASTTTSSATSVFWPEGVKKSGVCYGWLRPAICIAGVLSDVLDQNALDLLLSDSNLWAALRQSCGGDPTLLGTCTFDEGGPSPVPTSLKMWSFDDKHETIWSFVLYRCHVSHSLRFYVLEPPHVFPTPSSSTRNPWQEISRHDFTRTQPINIDQALNDTVIHQLNASSLLHSILQSPSKSPKLLPTTASFLLTLASYLGSLTRPALSISKIAADVANIPLLPTFDHVIGTSRKGDPRYMRLKEISATVQQFDVRIDQAVFFITQVTSLQRQNTYDTAFYSRRYTNFFNTAWLIMNDMTLGYTFGTFLSENSDFLADVTNDAVQKLLFNLPRTTLFWLDAWPAGLKLNAELSRFYVTTLVGIIDTWHSILPPLSPTLFNTLGFLSTIGGLTLLLSLLSDLLSLYLIVHLRIGYELTRVVYWAGGVKLGGGLLWGVFRGKRRNVLRNRTDTWSYDIDQLLFGTVLFTLLAFLFPTALVYYVLFAGLRLATLLVQACIETLLAFMHHFPLFALMLRVKDPWRLPVELWNRLVKHYNPLRLLYQVLAGQHLASISRYSMRYASRSGGGDSRNVAGKGKEKEKEE